MSIILRRKEWSPFLERLQSHLSTLLSVSLVEQGLEQMDSEIPFNLNHFVTSWCYMCCVDIMSLQVLRYCAKVYCNLTSRLFFPVCESENGKFHYSLINRNCDVMPVLHNSQHFFVFLGSSWFYRLLDQKHSHFGLNRPSNHQNKHELD